ncbi:MAG: hypothetical protein ACKVU4_04740 [Phycisphaerales bacterium]
MAENSSPIFTERPTPVARLRLIRRLRPRARCAALIGVLPSASAAEREFITTAVLSTVRDVVEAEAARRALRGRARTIGDLARIGHGVLFSGATARVLDDAARALLSGWGYLSEPQRVWAGELVRRDELSRRWRRLVNASPALPSSGDRRSAAEALGDLVDPGLARPLAVMILDRDARVADAAERSLRRLVEFALSRGAGRIGDETADETLDGAVADAARAFRDHRRRGVLESAALLLDLPRRSRGRRADAGGHAPLSRWFEDREHESHLALRAVVRRSSDARMRARAWEWLGESGGSVTTAALDRVARAATREDHEAVLVRSHLLANPMRARRAGMLAAGAPRQPTGGPLPIGAGITRLTLAARRGLPRLAGALLAADAARAKALEPLLADPDAAVRHAAARAVPPGHAVDYCFDADERVARHAVVAASGAGLTSVEGEQPAWRWRALARSPHAVVRWIAADELDRADPWAADSAASRVGLRRSLVADRAGVLTELRARLAFDDAALRCAAIVVARRLGVAGELEQELTALVTGPGESPSPPPERAAAAATTALGDLDTQTARSTIHAALAHPVPRVRANAVEAFVRQGRRHGFFAAPPSSTIGPPSKFALVELKHDRHHRVRANAIRALLDGVANASGAAAVDPGAELASMLSDDRPMHRVAALWLAERVLARGGSERHGWNELAVRVAGLAKEEPEPAVRVRADRCARRALAAMRTRWRDRVTAEDRA